jgi:hypothetical protein
MEVGGQLHGPSDLPSEKEQPVPVRKETEWVPEPVSMLLDKETYLSPVENRTPTFQPIVGRYTD